MNELRHGTVEVDGLSSPLIESGPADAREAVIFVHGSPGSLGDFRDLVARTGGFARAIAIDMPGFGQADKPHPHDFEYSGPGIGVHLAKQLESIGVERAHYVGHDFGGAFAHFSAMYNPRVTGSLTMVNTGVMRGYRWHPWARAWRTPVLGEFLMLVTNRRGFEFAMRDLPAGFVAEMWRNFDRRTRRAVLALYRATNHEDTTAGIPLIRAMNWPSLVIWGAADPYIPAKFAQRQLETLPSASIHVMSTAGHWPFIDEPQAFSELLMPFLRDVIESSAKTSDAAAAYR